jgi:hypothetical protein
MSGAERRDYFEWLIRTRPGWGSLYERRFRDRERKLPPTEALAQSVHADVVLRVAHLNELASKGGDVALERDTKAWLVRQVDWLHSAYRNREADLGAIGPDTPFRKAEATFGQWFSRAWATFSPEERLGVLHNLYDVERPDAFPGIDRFGLGWSIIDAWQNAGRPVAGSDKDPNTKLYDEILCPSTRDARGEHTRGRSCSSASIGWMAFATRSDESRKNVARMLDARDDAALADQFFFTLRGTRDRRAERDGKKDPFLEVLHALDARRKSWRAAMDVLIHDRDRALDDEAAYVWKTYPEHRGTALLLLAQSKWDYGGQYNLDNYWREFPKRFGSAIDAAALSQMLEHGKLGLVQLPTMWLGLGRFSRADVIVPRLDALVPDASAPEAGDALRSLSAITTRLCTENQTADLAKLHGYLVTRTARHPNEGSALSILTRDSAPGGCRARTKSPNESD